MGIEIILDNPTNSPYFSTNTKNLRVSGSINALVSQFILTLNGVSEILIVSSNSNTFTSFQKTLNLLVGVNTLDVSAVVQGVTYFLGRRSIEFINSEFITEFEFDVLQVRSEIFQNQVVIFWHIEPESLPYLKSFNIYRSYHPLMEESSFELIDTVFPSAYDRVILENEVDLKIERNDDGTTSIIKKVVQYPYLRFFTRVNFDPLVS